MCALVRWAVLMFMLPALQANGAEVFMEAGGSTPVLEAAGTSQVLDATLRMITVRNGHAQIYFGEVERTIKGELTAKDDSGNQVGTAEFELPIRFGFVGADIVAETAGWIRVGVAAGLAIFDKVDKAVDGTAWRFHFGAWITMGRDFILSIGAHHFSNGEDTPLKTRGPNNPLEFVTLAAGLKF